MGGNYQSYLISLGEIIKEYAAEAKRNKDLAMQTKNEEFATGYLCGLHRIITLMQQQAEIFDISLHELGLDINETDLI